MGESDLDRLAFPLQPGERRTTFDLGPPPDADATRSGRAGAHWRRIGPVDQKGHERRGVPETHRELRRSSSTQATADLPGLSSGRGRVKKSAGSVPLPAAITPARTRCATPASGAVAASSRATGRPRSRIITGPRRSPSISLLKLFLASVMLAVFIELL